MQPDKLYRIVHPLTLDIVFDEGLTCPAASKGVPLYPDPKSAYAKSGFNENEPASILEIDATNLDLVYEDNVFYVHNAPADHISIYRK